MRLICTVSIGNRLLPAHAVKNAKHVKSTLALCKHPKHENDFMIILFTAQHKTGVKYRLINNVSTILTRFINEGKATIQFKEPSHDLFIQADVIQLKGFLHLLKRALEKKISAKELTLSSMSVTPVAQKNIPPKKLVIERRSELPVKGFPRTLEYLSITKIDLCKLCIGVLKLQNLRTLDISENKIEYLPQELNKLRLEVLNVSQNELGKSLLKQWNWIGGPLLKSLKQINLSRNNLTFLPEQFAKLQELRDINLDYNNLTALPYGFGNFRNLRNLSIVKNKLTQVPGSMRRLRLEYLNLAENNFHPISVAAIFPKVLPVQTLKECAARKVLFAKLPYSAETIPYTLVDYLDYAYYCICGKPCFEVHLHHPNVLSLNLITQSVISNAGDSNYVPMDCYYCCVRCFRRTNYV